MHILLIFTEKSSPPTLGPVSRVKEKKSHGGTSYFWIHVTEYFENPKFQNRAKRGFRENGLYLTSGAQNENLKPLFITNIPNYMKYTPKYIIHPPLVVKMATLKCF